MAFNTTANTHNDEAVFTSDELKRFAIEANGKLTNFEVTAVREGERIRVESFTGYSAEEAIRYAQAVAQDMQSIYGMRSLYAACNLSDWQATEEK